MREGCSTEKDPPEHEHGNPHGHIIFLGKSIYKFQAGRGCLLILHLSISSCFQMQTELNAIFLIWILTWSAHFCCPEAPVLYCHDLPVQPAPVSFLQLSLPLPAQAVQPEALAGPHPPPGQMAPPSGKCAFPVGTYSSVGTAISVFTVFPNTLTQPPCFPFHILQVHIHICFVQGSVIRGCHLFLKETVSCTAGHRIGKILRGQRVSVLCTRCLPFHRIGVLYMGYFVLHCYSVINK